MTPDRSTALPAATTHARARASEESDPIGGSPGETRATRRGAFALATRRALLGAALAIGSGPALGRASTPRAATWADVGPALALLHRDGARAVAAARAKGLQPSQLFNIVILGHFGLLFQRAPGEFVTVYGGGGVVR